jgi:hypothetical protein
MENLIQGSGEARLHADPRQHARDQSLLRAQLLLLLRQVAQKKAHYEEVDRFHEKALRFKRRNVNV